MAYNHHSIGAERTANFVGGIGVGNVAIEQIVDKSKNIRKYNQNC